MRVSTQQFYFQNSQLISNRETELNDQIKYLSSGKKVLTAKDDAIQFNALSGYKEQLTAIDKYKRNITQAISRNSSQDVHFGQAEDSMQEVKELLIQANNGANSTIDLKTIAAQVSGVLKQMVDLANSSDENGHYVFAGYKIETKPFTMQADNSVTYNGDSGVRKLQISQGMLVDMNQAGDKAFQSVPNPSGDFSAIYNTNVGGITVNNATIVDRANHDSVGVPPDYTLTFTDPNGDGVAELLTVTDSSTASILTVNPYTPEQTFTFNGVEVKVNGIPKPGDQLDLTPKQEISVFDAIKNAIDWMVTPANGTVSKSAEYSDILSQVNASLSYVSERRAESGVRLQLIEQQERRLLDRELSLAQGASNIEDLDYAKAVASFEQSQIALQVSQQTFIQVKNLSLFNYL